MKLHLHRRCVVWVVLLIAQLDSSGAIDSSQVLKSLVLIETETNAGKTSGTGFFLRDQDEVYLVTNQHIIFGAREAKFYSIFGTEPKLRSFEFSLHQDLVRFHVASEHLDPRIVPLSLVGGSIAINDPVTVYGNSEGGKVATEIKGKILGVGPDVIETDAGFVSGNSGSPVLNKDGQVVAVATYAIHPEFDDWIKKGTRFENVRRFGVRVAGQDWQKVSPNSYLKATREIADIQKFLNEVEHIIFGSLNKDSIAIETTNFIEGYKLDIGLKRYSDPEWAQRVENFCRMFIFEERKLFPDRYGTKFSESSKRRVLRRSGTRLKNMIAAAQKSLRDLRMPGKYLQGRVTEVNEHAEILKKYVAHTAFFRFAEQQ